MILEYILTAMLTVNILVIIGTIVIVRIVVKDLSNEPQYDVMYICEGYADRYTKDVRHAKNFKKIWCGYQEMEK